jgi:hypothetical protein
MAQADKNRKIMQKILIGCGILPGNTAFHYFDLGQYLSLDYLKSSQAKFQVLYKRKFKPAAAQDEIHGS